MNCLFIFCLILDSAEQLWKSVTSVSNAGRRRGRGKRGSKKLAKNLNRGQKIGYGKVPVLFPGLNSPVLSGSVLVKMQMKPKVEDEPDADRSRVITSVPNRKRARVDPLQRGWSSASMCGRRIGPPDPIKDRKKSFFKKPFQK